MRIPIETRELTPGDAGYPAALEALAPPPPRVWLRGCLPTGRAVSVVGSRAASGAALRQAREIGLGLAARGVTVVSGGALGVDGAAHEGALDGGGATVAVLGTGVDVLYPVQNRALLERVLARPTSGALLSPFPPGSPATPWHFPARNPLVAALGEACIVVAAASTSGSLYTATAARRLRRPVISLVGTPGCDALAIEGATAARSVEDVLALIDGRKPAAPAPPEDPVSARLYAALDEVPRELGEIAARAGIAVADAMARAIDLEIAGLAVRAPGGRYQRVS